MHGLCQKHDVGLFCGRCNSNFQGRNTGSERYFVIECKCRELKFENPRFGRAPS